MWWKQLLRTVSKHEAPSIRLLGFPRLTEPPDRVARPPTLVRRPSALNCIELSDLQKLAGPFQILAHACVLDGLRPQTGTHGRKSKKLCFRLRRRNQDDLLCINLTSIIRASSMTWHHSPSMTIINGEILWRRRCNGTGKLAGVQLEFRPGRKRHNLFSVTPKPNYYCVATFLPKLDLELHRAISSTTRTAFYYLWRAQTLSSSSTQPPTIPSGTS